MLGKHYTVAPLQDARVNGATLKRQYTVANCMRPTFYKELVRCLQGQVAADSFRFHFLNQDPTELIYLTIKNYQVKNGLSKRIFESKNHLFKIKGPMGKGLGLTEYSEGNYVAFTAGTGILPFMDLVTRIALCDMRVFSK